MNIENLLISATNRLKKIKYSSSNFEAREILKRVTGYDDLYILTNPEKELSISHLSDFEKLLERRLKYEPLQYILGEVYFYRDLFKIYPGVLIPRQDTEISVEKIIEISKRSNAKSFLEIGCGSGCVSLSVAKYTDLIVTCCDISEKAILNTKENLTNFSLDINVIKSDLFNNISGKFDIIYSNPPYIPTDEILNLQQEIINYEPLLALDGGKDGLDFYKKIIDGSDKFLNKAGYLIFEIGHDQRLPVTDLMIDYDVSCYKDLSGRDRVIVGRRR